MDSREKSIIEDGKFYRIIEDVTLQVRRNTPGGGYESFPTKVKAGAVIKGHSEHTGFKVYDGMPVKETTHEVRVEGLDLSKTNSDNSMNTDARAINNKILEEITEEEYKKTSKAFFERTLA